MCRKKVNREFSKRAQLKILESVAVLIVFFFLVAMGIGFYGKVQLQALKEAKDEFKSADATKISQKVIHLPEIRCSLQNTDQGSCIDIYQAKAWASTIDDAGCLSSDGLGDADLCGERTKHYFEQMGLAEIILTRTYTADPVRATLNPDIVLYNSSAPERRNNNFVHIPVIIQDSVAKTNDLGMLVVVVYE